jgi:protein gp37
MAKQGEHGISWTDETWNPTRGCSRVSEGCRNCYAEAIAARFSGPGQAFEGFAKIGRTVMTNGQQSHVTPYRWTGKVELVEERLEDPLRWRKPRRVFVNSMSDLFHEALPDEAIDRVFAVMALCPQHTFQVLTKRPERMRKYSQKIADGLGGLRAAWANHRPMPNQDYEWPLPNCWLGVSVEDKPTAKRIVELIQTPATVRFVSYEPALGPVDFTTWLSPEHWAIQEGEEEWRHREDCPCNGTGQMPSGLDLIIAGGESGPGARPSHPQWFRDVRDQCVAAGVAFHFKQWGEFVEPGQMDREVWEHWASTRDVQPDEGPVRVGKKAAGRLLDGKLWDQFPEVNL